MEISIHAIAGYHGNNAMKLLGRIGTCPVEILVDLESTHNFLDPLVVNAVTLQVYFDSSLQVRVANGAKVMSKGSCEEVITIQGAKFTVHFPCFYHWGVVILF